MGPLPRRDCRAPRGPRQEEVGLTRSLDISSRAARDLREVQDYLDEKSPRAGVFFEDEADACLLALAAHPFVRRVIQRSSTRDAGLRSWRVSNRFWQYLVYYRVFSHSVRIVRVLHSARNVRSILRLPR